MDENKGKIEVKEWKDLEAEYSGKNATVVLGANAYKVIDDEGYDPHFRGIVEKLKKKGGEFEKLFTALGHPNLRLALKSLIDAIHLHHQFAPGSDDKENDVFLKKSKVLLDELFTEVKGFEHSRIKEAMAEENDPHSLFFDFVTRFRYVCSLNFAWILYWMMLIKLGKEGWGDLFGSPCHDNILSFSDLSKRHEYLNDSSRKIMLFPYGSIFLVQDKECQDPHTKENKLLKVGKIRADKKNDNKFAPTMIQYLLRGCHYPFFYTELDLNDEVEDAFFKSNEYFDFFYNTVVPDYIGKGAAVLYGFQEIRDREYLLKHLFQHVRQIAVSVADKQNPEEVLKVLEAIEKDCGRDPSKGAIAFEFFKSESILHK